MSTITAIILIITIAVVTSTVTYKITRWRYRLTPELKTQIDWLMQVGEDEIRRINRERMEEHEQA
jgi:hypothetical protein